MRRRCALSLVVTGSEIWAGKTCQPDRQIRSAPNREWPIIWCRTSVLMVTNANTTITSTAATSSFLWAHGLDTQEQGLEAVQQQLALPILVAFISPSSFRLTHYREVDGPKIYIRQKSS